MTVKARFFVDDLRENWDILLSVSREHGMPMPNLEQVLGCGGYGCVFATEDPKTVLKYTQDKNEALLMAYQAQTSFSGIVSVNYVGQFGSDDFFIWRDGLDLCCKQAIDHISDLTGALPSFRKDMKDALSWYSNVRDNYVDEMWQEGAMDASDSIANIPGLRDLGAGLRDLAEQDLVLEDLHSDNFGCFLDYDQLLVFDGMLDTLSGDDPPNYIEVID